MAPARCRQNMCARHYHPSQKNGNNGNNGTTAHRSAILPTYHRSVGVV